jgi:ferrous iron transport protein B
MSQSAPDLKPLIALVGAPNSGKTTLYNWLTNSNFKTVNYPGATVDYSVGTLAPRFGKNIQLMDTPGTYSLFPKSADEVVTLRALYEETPYGRVNKVVVVLDTTQLERHISLAKQIHRAGFQMILVLTMRDLFEKLKIQINLDILKKEFDCPVLTFDGRLGAGLNDIVNSLNPSRLHEPAKLLHEDEKNFQANNYKELVDKVLSDRNAVDKIYDATAKIDKILMHPVLGLLFFSIIMSLLFTSVYSLATPFMDLIDQTLSGAGEVIKNYGQGALWSEFVSGGIIASFSAVLVFVPQIFILFLLMSWLESSGYLARAATLIDKPFSLVGLSGRSFVPLLSGYACAVPAIMATRNISSPRDRFITNMVIPLTSCSARLPVYALLLSFVFPEGPAWKAGIILAGIYFLSLILSAFAAMILNFMISKHGNASYFMMELPLYRRPRFWMQIVFAWQKTKSYALRAGPIIFILAVVLWFGTNFPKAHFEPQNQTQAESNTEERIEQSYIGKLGQVIEPVLAPMGLDWKVGIGLISAFAAREVFVSTMALVYQVSGDEDTQKEGLLKAMSDAKNSNGQPVFTVASVAALVVFFMIALQCLSTVAIAIKEFGSAKKAVIQLIVLNIAAYVLAVATYQILA